MTAIILLILIKKFLARFRERHGPLVQSTNAADKDLTTGEDGPALDGAGPLAGAAGRAVAFAFAFAAGRAFAFAFAFAAASFVSSFLILFFNLRTLAACFSIFRSLLRIVAAARR